MTATELIVPVVWAGTCHLAMWNAGSRIGPLVEPAREDEPVAQRAFLAAMLGFAVLSTVAVLLACLKLLYAPVLIGGVLALAADGAIRLYRARPRALPRMTAARLAAIVVALGAVAYVPAALDPVLEHDESTYHLLLPKVYLAAHGLVALPWNVFANMPHQTDLAFVGPLAIGDAGAARLFVFGFALWTLVGMASIARRIAGEWGPALATLLYLGGANVRFHLGLANVEPVLGAVLLGAVLSLSAGWRRGAAPLRTFAILVGTACATKYTGWLFAAVLFAAASVSVLRSSGSLRRRLLGLGALAAIAAVPLAPWLVKNAIVTGNPIYPTLFHLLGGAHWSEIQDLHMARSAAVPGGADKTLWSYLLLPFSLVFREASFFSPSFSAGLMALFLAAMCVPWRRGDPSTRLRLVALGGFAAWATGVQQGRFLVAWIPVMVVAACHALAPLRGVRAAPVVVVLSMLGVALAQARWQPNQVLPRFDVFKSSREELLVRDPAYRLATFLKRIVPPGGTALGMWENRFYHLDRASIADGAWESPVVLAGLRESGDAVAFARGMASLGVTHVVLGVSPGKLFLSNGMPFDLLDDRVYPETRLRADAELLDRFIEEHLELVFSEGDWLVFRLREAESPGPVSGSAPGFRQGE